MLRGTRLIEGQEAKLFREVENILRDCLHRT